MVVKTDECSVEAFSRFHRESQITLVTARASRGGQIRHGIVNSESSFIWVLHADSVIDDSTIKAVSEMATRQDEVWGRFNLSLIPRTRMLQLISFLVNFRSRKTKICTGDQGMFFHRSLLRHWRFSRSTSYGRCRSFKKVETRICGSFLARRTNCSKQWKRWLTNGYMKTILSMGVYELDIF